VGLPGPVAVVELEAGERAGPLEPELLRSELPLLLDEGRLEVRRELRLELRHDVHPALARDPRGPPAGCLREPRLELGGRLRVGELLAQLLLLHLPLRRLPLLLGVVEHLLPDAREEHEVLASESVERKG
jgi:hypothetical protein